MAKDPNEIGALWEKSGSKGPYMTGTINGERIVVFRNDKGSEKSPQWRILKATPKPSAPADDDIGF